MSAIDKSIIDLKAKNPSISENDLKELKETTKSAIDSLNSKMSLIINFLQTKYPELKQCEQ